MGYIVDEVVAVVLWDSDDVKKCREFAESLPGAWRELFAFIPSVVNRSTTVVMGSDGSKEGWHDSNTGDQHREAFLALLATCGGRGVHVSMPEDDATSITETASRYDDEREWLDEKGGA